MHPELGGKGDPNGGAPKFGPMALGASVADECGIVDWIQGNGGRVLTDGVEIADIEVSIRSRDRFIKIIRRGLRTTRALGAKEEIVFLPEHLMLTKKTAMQNPTIRAILKKHPKEAIHHLVIFFYLLEAENPKSFFKPYFCNQPKKPPQPIFFTDEELRDFKSQHVVKDTDEILLYKMFGSNERMDEAIQEQRESFEESYEHFKTIQAEFPEAFPKAVFTREKHFQAHAMLISRSFSWNAHGESGYTMTPFMDLPNRDKSLLHQQLRTVIKYAPDNEIGQALETASPVAKGREIFVDYGEDCNEHFVMTYGFVPSYCHGELTDPRHIQHVIQN